MLKRKCYFCHLYKRDIFSAAIYVAFSLRSKIFMFSLTRNYFFTTHTCIMSQKMVFQKLKELVFSQLLVHVLFENPVMGQIKVLVSGTD